MTQHSEEGMRSLSRQLLHPRFWLDNRGLLAAAFFGLIPIILFTHLTHPPNLGWLQHISTAVLLIAGWGFLVAVRAASRIEVDDFIARQIGRRTAVCREKLRNQTIARIALDSLSDWIPRQVHWQLGMVRLLDLILEEAQDRKYHPPAVLTQPFRERSLSAIVRLRTLQRIALQLGILGTFLGLLRAISDLSFEGGIVPEAIPRLISSLHLSFGTSIAGLEVSVILGVLVMALRDRLENYWDVMETTVRDFIALTRRSEVTDEYLVEFSQLRETLEQLKGRISSHAAEVRLQTAEIQSGLVRVAEVKGQFDDFLNDLRGEQVKVLAEFESVYDIISPRKTAEELEAGLRRSMSVVAEDFRGGLEKGMKELQRYDQSLEGFRGTLVELRTSTSAVLEDLGKSRLQLEEGSRQAGAQMEKMVKLQGKLLERLDKTSHLDVSRLVGDMSALVRRTDQSIDRHLEAFLAKLERQLSRQQTIHHKTNSLLSELTQRSSFFDALVVRPWRWIRTRSA